MIFERTAIKKLLSQLDQIPFSVCFENNDTMNVGKGEPLFTVRINEPISKKELMTSTSLALGEAYMRRSIEVDGDLFTALNVVLSQIDKFSVNARALDKILHSSTKAKHQKEEVGFHYNIGNDFYRLWLDETLNYSCGYFPRGNETLYEAQVKKTHHLLQKLHLQRGMRLLDIGCGWGYLLIAAAKEYGVSGVGITLSDEQYKECRRKAREEGLEDRVKFLLMDYRELRKSQLLFDRVISVGMLEHVGRDNYDLFFENVDAVLKPEGIFLLHFISALKENPGDPWMKKYIFPGGVIPSLREILHIAGDYHFYTIDVESLRRHYVKTLLCWSERFQQNRGQVLSMFDDQFVRMWELYLCACAASFNNGVIDLHQILFSKGINNDIPMIRENYR
ncbi:SAM-dependent methyltransferase [Bacilliculturomica massiliensis]|uniref:SAM-dependent methyltransferase n=1 Tax=Bacilliculturomica massiliensis TaxID=1917867 RepID=UPI001030441A|nr:cyclopropane-fatty-acyl-phospholipid synthase family protein [Bacilliculturomica massiliensis]